MSMFDTVIIEGLKLPPLSKEVQSYLKSNNKELPNDFQTKDLDNCLSTFTINKSGQIFLTEYKPTGRKVPYKPLQLSHWVDNRSVLEKIYFYFRNKKFNKSFPLPKFTEERKPVKVKTHITETFEIYNYTEINGRYLDFSYNITAVNGKVTKVVVGNSNLESLKDSNKRKKESEIFEKNISLQLEKQRKFRSKWYYPILKETYNPFIFFLSKAVQFTCNKLTSWSYRWSGV